MPLFRIIPLLLIFSFFSTATASDLHKFEYSEVVMGVKARIVVYAPNQDSAGKACHEAFERMSYLESIMSDYRPDSELMRLSNQPTTVSPELFHIIHKSQKFAWLSNGAFDITVGPYIQLWREARQSGVLPPAEELENVREKVGWQKIDIGRKAGTVMHRIPGMKLDLGGIAKGYACDEALEILKNHGLSRALVEMGGDIVVGDAPPGKDGWEIRIANAEVDKLEILSNAAISSSGDTEQFVEIDGTRYSHIVDPKTGIGLTNRISVTVIAPDGITSDAISTTISVLGEEKGRRFVEKFPRAIVYIKKSP